MACAEASSALAAYKPFFYLLSQTGFRGVRSSSRKVIGLAACPTSVSALILFHSDLKKLLLPAEGAAGLLPELRDRKSRKSLLK